MQPEPLIEQYVGWIRCNLDREALQRALEACGFSQTDDDSNEDLALALADFCVTTRLDPADPELLKDWQIKLDGEAPLTH